MSVRMLLVPRLSRFYAVRRRVARLRAYGSSVVSTSLMLAFVAALVAGCGGGGGELVTPGGPPVTPPAGATQLAILTQPSGGFPQSVLTPALQVQLRNASGGAVTTAGVSVSVAIQSAPIGGTLLGTLSQSTDSAGVAMFGDLRLSVVGGYFLRVSAAGLPSLTSQPINIFGTPPPPQTPTHLAFTVQPSTTEAGLPIVPAVRVEVRDGAGAVVTSSSASVTLALEGGTAGASLVGTATLNATAGAATLSGLSVSLPGTGYRLRATSNGLAAALSSSFVINDPPGPPVSLRFMDPIPDVTAHAPIPDVRVEVLDAQGRRVTNQSVTVDIRLREGTTGALWHWKESIAYGEPGWGISYREATEPAVERPVMYMKAKSLRFRKAAYSFVDRTIYGIGPGDSSADARLVSLRPGDHVPNLEIPITSPPDIAANRVLDFAIAIRSDGRLLAANSDPSNEAVFFELEKTTGAFTRQGKPSIPGNTISAIRSMVTDPRDGSIMCACSLADDPGQSFAANIHLVRLDPSTLQCTYIQRMPSGVFDITCDSEGVLFASVGGDDLSLTERRLYTWTQQNPVWLVLPTQSEFAGFSIVCWVPSWLRGVTTVSTTAGVATFTGLRSALVEPAAALVAESTNLTQSTSNEMMIQARPVGLVSVSLQSPLVAVMENAGPVTVIARLTQSFQHDVHVELSVTGNAWGSPPWTESFYWYTSLYGPYDNGVFGWGGYEVIVIPAGATAGALTFGLVDDNVWRAPGQSFLEFAIARVHGASTGATTVTRVEITDDD